MRNAWFKFAAALALSILLVLGSSPAQALCEPMLVLSRGDKVLAHLGSCDVDPLPRLQGVAGMPELSLSLRPAALERWQSVLGTHGADLAGAQLQLGPTVSGSLSLGVLLPAASARHVGHGHWRWDPSNRLSLYQPARSAAPVRACSEPRLRAQDRTPLVVWFGDREVVPGELVLAHPFLTAHPGERSPVPGACLGVWTQGGAPELHMVSAALGVFQVPLAADPGRTYRLSVAAGERTAQGVMQVLGAAEAKLVGRWVQVAEYSCDMPGRPLPPGDPIRELALSGRGTLSITWQPFESRVDMRGTWHLLTQEADQRVLLQVADGAAHGTAPVALGYLLPDGELDLPSWRVGTSSRSGDTPRGPCGARMRRVGS